MYIDWHKQSGTNNPNANKRFKMIFWKLGVRTKAVRSKVRLLEENEWMAEYNGTCNSELMLLKNTRLWESWPRLSGYLWLLLWVSNPSPFRFRRENCLLWITTQQQRATVTLAVIGWHFKNALSSKQSEIKISVQSIQSKKSLRLSVNYWILKVLPATGKI